MNNQDQPGSSHQNEDSSPDDDVEEIRKFSEFLKKFFPYYQRFFSSK